jgi:hypothetical protein
MLLRANGTRPGVPRSGFQFGLGHGPLTAPLLTEYSAPTCQVKLLEKSGGAARPPCTLSITVTPDSSRATPTCDTGCADSRTPGLQSDQ